METPHACLLVQGGQTAFDGEMRSRLVRVLYTFEAREPDEMTIREGEMVEVLSAEDEWWMGRIGGRVGSFPSNYVEAQPRLNQRYSSAI